MERRERRREAGKNESAPDEEVLLTFQFDTSPPRCPSGWQQGQLALGDSAQYVDLAQYAVVDASSTLSTVSLVDVWRQPNELELVNF